MHALGVIVMVLTAARSDGVSGAGASAAASFAVVRNKILLPVTINGTGPYPFILDTVAERTIVDRALATTLGHVPRAMGPDSAASLLFVPESLSIADRLVPVEMMLVADLTPLAGQLGRPVSGILCGRTLDGPITLDFAAGRVSFDGGIPSPPAPGGVQIQLDDVSRPTVQVLINGVHIRRVVVDTMFSGVFALPESLAEETGVLAQNTVRLTVVGSGDRRSGATHVRLDRLDVGRAKIRQPLCAILAPGSPPLLGVGFLKHFRVTLDLPGAQLVLTRGDPAPLVDAPVVGCGLSLACQEDGGWIVDVAAGSPADRAGVLPGDRLSKVNGVAMGDEPYDTVLEELGGDEGDTIDVTIMRDGRTLSFLLPFERLL